jgi:hypothetical protein
MRFRRVRRPAPVAPLPPILCRWDLDKTYLRSEFDSLRSLLRTAFEKAEDKVDVPGVAELIRSLKGAAERRGRPAFVHFISASPPQIGSAIRKKLARRRRTTDRLQGPAPAPEAREAAQPPRHVGLKLAELLRGCLEAPARPQLSPATTGSPTRSSTRLRGRHRRPARRVDRSPRAPPHPADARLLDTIVASRGAPASATSWSASSSTRAALAAWRLPLFGRASC